MINRGLLRMKVLQMLYAFYVNNGTDIETAQKELKLSVEKSYDLYYAALLLLAEIGRYAGNRLEMQRVREMIDGGQTELNNRFVESPFLKFLDGRRDFWTYVERESLSWADHGNVVREMYNKLVTSEYYIRYMEADEVTIDDDKRLWRKILNKIVIPSESFAEAIEEMSIYWLDDVELILSFVERAIKFYDKDDEAVDLMPVAGGGGDMEFAGKLLELTIVNGDRLEELLRPNLVRWELERMSLVDTLLLKMSLTELLSFESIPTSVILNVYIDLTKIYSTPKSAKFVNGILDKMLKEAKVRPF